MTKQETFNIVVAHARTMTDRCRVGAACSYRAPDGGRCFAGCLIPDAMYQPDMEGKLSNHRDMLDMWVELGHSQPLVDDLQRVHDHWPTDEWEGQLKRVAGEHSLTYKGV